MKHWLLLIMAATMFALVAACGDDDDDDGGDALTEEEYFARMDEIDKDLDAELDEVFSDQEADARALADGFSDAAGNAVDQYEDVSAPDDLDDEHEALVDAINGFRDALGAAADDLEEDAPSDEFQTLFEDEGVSAANEEVVTAYCTIQDAADAAGVEADVGCEESDDGGEDPASLPPEETTDVLIEDFVFEPAHIQVSVGDTVTWTQGADPEPHTATADDGSFDTGILTDEGETGEVTFDEAGTFSYFCEVHPDMVGAVTVVE